MDKEIIIERKKIKSFGYGIFLLIMSLIMSLPCLAYFFKVNIFENEIPFYIIIISIIITPILFVCSFFYFKQMFNNIHVLVINANGLDEKMSHHPVGIIKWRDIKDITVIPYMGGTYFIGIILKDPEIYIQNEKLLNKLNKQKSTKKWGHISFSSIYFKKEVKEVLELMKYYYELYKNDNFYD